MTMSIEVGFPDTEKTPRVYSERERQQFSDELGKLQAVAQDATTGLSIHVNDLECDGDELARCFRGIEAKVSRDATNARYARIGQRIIIRHPAIVAIAHESDEGVLEVLTLKAGTQITGEISGVPVNLFPKDSEGTDDDDNEALVLSVTLNLRGAVIAEIDPETGEVLNPVDLKEDAVDIPLCYGVDGIQMPPKPPVHYVRQVSFGEEVVDTYPKELSNLG